MTIGHPDEVIATHAREAGGPFTYAQARRAGLSEEQIEHRVRSGQWRRVHPRVFVHAPVILTPDVRRRAALQWAGTRAVLSHRSAAEVWGFEGVVAERPELTVVGSRHPRSPDVIVHRTLRWTERHDRVRRSGLALTSPTRTVVDLAGVVDIDTLRIAFESARRNRQTTVRKVRNRVDAVGGRGRPGAARLRILLDELDGRAPAESVLESRVAGILRRSGCEPPVRQYEVAVAGRVIRLDYAWPPRRLALECDGRLRHSEDSDFRRDRERWSLLAAIGWRILFVTWADLAHPDRIVDRLRTALAA